MQLWPWHVIILVISNVDYQIPTYFDIFNCTCQQNTTRNIRYSTFNASKSIKCQSYYLICLDDSIEVHAKILRLFVVSRSALFSFPQSVLFPFYFCRYSNQPVFCSAHQTTNFTNSEFQFTQCKVLQSVLIFSMISYIGVFFYVFWP